MPKKRFSDEQIAFELRQAEAGTGSARCLPPRSGNGGLRACAPAVGAGILLESSVTKTRDKKAA